MNRWKIIYPGKFNQIVEEIWTEEQIIESFYDQFSEKMLKVGKQNLVSNKNCIEDWVVINYAVKL